MSFLPLGRDAGQRAVRWPRLVLAWLLILSASLLGSCAMGYLLTGDAWRFAWVGIWMGALCCAPFAVDGFTRHVGKLPPVHPSPSSGVRHA
jgi:hypothetical protein